MQMDASTLEQISQLTGARITSKSPTQAAALFHRTELVSAFQPLISSDNGSVAGSEAFVRSYAWGENAMAPWSLFSHVADDDSLVRLDRLCRTVHVVNSLLAGVTKTKSSTARSRKINKLQTAVPDLLAYGR